MFFKKRGLILILVALNSNLFAQNYPTKFTKDQRHLSDAAGKTYFWLGDAANELFFRLNKFDAQFYFQKRKEQGFNVIYASFFSAQNNLIEHSVNGCKTLDSINILTFNQCWLNHVKEIIGIANKNNLVVALNPAWGDKWNKKDGNGPEFLNEANAFRYGKFLSDEFSDLKIIWVLGGDRNPENIGHFRTLEAMAMGIKKGKSGSKLLGFHPSPEKSTAQFLKNANWINFHSYSSGGITPVFTQYDSLRSLAALQKPFIDIESSLEGALKSKDKTAENNIVTALEFRNKAYQSLLMGAMGVQYGHIATMNFDTPERVSEQNYYKESWKKALKAPGTQQIAVLRKLFQRYDLAELVPHLEYAYPAATIPSQKVFLMYVPKASIMLTFQPKAIGGKNVKVEWLNTASGESQDAFFKFSKGKIWINPPEWKKVEDAMLIIKEN